MIKKIFRTPLIIFRRIKHLYWDFTNELNFLRYHIIIGVNHNINGILIIKNAGSIVIGDYFSANAGKLNNPIGGDTELRLICQKGAKIQIGSNCGISNSTLWANESIVIEDNVLIGGGCKIWDNDFHSIDAIKRVSGSEGIRSKPIVLKKNSFIGGNSILLKGVTIGEGSIVGAGSVVAKSIPKGEIWAGNPARYVKKV